MGAGNTVRFGVSMVLTLVALWVCLSGELTFTLPLIFGLGVASVAFVLYLSLRMDVLDTEGLPVWVHEIALAKYVLWLAREVVKANIDVTRHILSRDLRLSPVVVRLPARQHTVVGRVIYANSITLTPGTVAIELDDECVDVHALTRAGAEDLETGDMHDRVCQVEVVERV